MNSTVLGSTKYHSSSKISVNSIEIVLIFLPYNLNAFNAYLNTCYFTIYLKIAAQAVLLTRCT